jgi:hypothetical protein
MGVDTPISKSRDIATIIILITSMAINLILVSLLVSGTPLPPIFGDRTAVKPARYRSWPTWLTDLRPKVAKEPLKREPLNEGIEVIKAREPHPKFRGKLTHVLFSLRDTKEELANIKNTFDYWEAFPPCLVDSSPTNTSSSNVILTAYFDVIPSSDTLHKVQDLFNTLPSSVRSCFSTLEIRHTGLAPLKNSTSMAERMHWRSVFETLVTNAINLKEPNHVLILTSDTRPVQINWLNMVDNQTRPPNEQVWHRGSIFRGYIHDPPSDIGQMIRLSTAGLYFFADAAFADFYMTRVKPWVATNPQAITTEFGDRWSVDIFQYLADNPDANLAASYAVMHNFRHVNWIGDYHGRNVSLEHIHLENPDAVLITGNLVP